MPTAPEASAENVASERSEFVTDEETDAKGCRVLHSVLCPASIAYCNSKLAHSILMTDGSLESLWTGDDAQYKNIAPLPRMVTPHNPQIVLAS